MQKVKNMKDNMPILKKCIGFGIGVGLGLFLIKTLFPVVVLGLAGYAAYCIIKRFNDAD